MRSPWGQTDPYTTFSLCVFCKGHRYNNPDAIFQHSEDVLNLFEIYVIHPYFYGKI